MTTITSAKLPVSGYNGQTAKHYILNAGAVVKNLMWDKVTKKYSYDLVGATSGGSKLVAKNTLRQVEVDGVFVPAVGQDLIDEGELSLELNVIELTHQALKDALFATVENSDGETMPLGYKVITPKSKIEESDYIKNLAYIGTISGSNMPIIIVLNNAICTSGLELEFKDKGEAVNTMTFEGRTDADKVTDQALPVRIYYPDLDYVGGTE